MSNKEIITNLTTALNNHGIPVSTEPDFYPSNAATPYVVIGDVDYEKLNRAHNRVHKYVYTKNKAAISKVRYYLREFYKQRKNVKSANKIMIIISPDDCLSVRLVNRGFKTVNPYVLLDKYDKDDKKGLKPYVQKIDEYRDEFSKFSNFLRGLMTVNQKSKMDKLKAESSFKGVVANVGFALAVLSLKKEVMKVTQCYYDDEHLTFPFLELKSVAPDSAKEALSRLIVLHRNKNARYFSKLSKLLTKFYDKTDVNEENRLILGLPVKYGCVKNTCTDYNDMLGVFALYNMGFVIADKEKLGRFVEEVTLFTNFLNKK